jgi:GNAT superfamily N-acetyltransferase
MMERSVDRIGPGAIVLCHDRAGPGASRTETFDTPQLVRELCELARRRGLRPATLHDGTALGRLVVATHGASGRAAEMGVRPIDEDRIAADDHDAVRGLLAGVITRHAEEYAERGYRRLRPEYRVLVYADSGVVGTCSVFRIDAEPALRVYGIGDLVVSAEARGGGLARRMLRIAFSEAQRREADVVIGDTTAVATTLAGLGFKHVPRFRYFHERDGACSWAPNWWAWEREPIPAPRLLLKEGDF